MTKHRIDTTRPVEVTMADGNVRTMHLDDLVRPRIGQLVVVRSLGRPRLGHIVELKRVRVVVEVPRDRDGTLVRRSYHPDQVYVPSTQVSTSDGRS